MLVNLSEAERYLGSLNEQDEKIYTLLQLAERRVKSFCKREFEKSTYTERVVFSDGIGWVNETPLRSINSITHRDGYTVSVREFSEDGFIELWEDTNSIYTVNYEGGYETIPDDLKLAILRFMEYYLNKSEGVTGYNFEGTNVKFGTPDDVEAILIPYVRRRL